MHLGSEYRTWTAVDGNYQVEAIFRGMAFGKVKLERKDNSMIIELPIEKLSLEDQNWINNSTYNNP